MKTCPNCRNQMSEDAAFCPVCGTAVDALPQFHSQELPPENHAAFIPAPVPFVDPYDHTKEFDSGDIAANKLTVMCLYLLGPVGIIIAHLAANGSRYVSFHIQQMMKLTIVEILAALALVIISFLLFSMRLRIFMLFVNAIVLISLLMIHLICFLQVCMGKAKEVYVIRSLQFLR